MSRKNGVIWGCLLILAAGVVMAVYAQELQSGANEVALEESMSFVEVFKKGGLLMYPITVMSIIGVALIVYFFMVLRSEQIVPQGWFDELREDLSTRKLGDARILCNQKPSPISAVTIAALDYVEDTGRPESSLLKEIMEGSGGFVYTGWSGDPAVEERVKEETKATLRVIPSEEFRSETAPEKCISGDKSKMEVIWSKAY